MRSPPASKRALVRFFPFLLAAGIALTLFFVVVFLPREPGQPGTEALDILRRAAQAWKDVRTYRDVTRTRVVFEGEGLKQEGSAEMDAALARPNRLALRGKGTAPSFYSDGRKLTMFFPELNGFSTRDAPGTLEEVIAACGGWSPEPGRKSPSAPFVFLVHFLEASLGDAPEKLRVALLDPGGRADAHRLGVEDPGTGWRGELWIGKADARVREVKVDLAASEPPPAPGGARPPWTRAEAVEVHDGIRVDEELADSLFAFEPPAGAIAMELGQAGEGAAPHRARLLGPYKLRVDVVELAPPGDLEVGKTARGTLRTSAPEPGKSSAALSYELWSFQSQRKGVLRVILESDEFDPILCRLAHPEDLLDDAVEVDDESGPGSGAALFAGVEPGATYTFAAACAPEGSGGSYRLRADWHAPPLAPEARELPLGEAHAGALSLDDAERPSHVFHDAWLHSAAEDQVLAVEVRSADFEPSFRVHREQQRRPLTRNERPVLDGLEYSAAGFFRAEKGVRYRIEVSSLGPGDVGKYTVRLALAPKPPEGPKAQPIEIGKDLAGELTAAEESDLWSLSVEKPIRIVARVSSAGDFSPALRLKSYHPLAPVIREDYADTPNLELTADLFPGIPYFIEVAPVESRRE